MCYIMTLGVNAAFRRQGFGQIMLNQILNHFTDIETFGLHVHAGNTCALKFYKTKKFQIIRTIENYYRRIDPKSAKILQFNR